MPVNPQKTPWTMEREIMLVSLISSPYSCKWLAAEINKRTGSVFTRNSIIGKIHRMGLAKKAPKIVSRQNRPKKPRDRRVRVERVMVDLFADFLPPPDFIGIQFAATSQFTCMYPEGDGVHMLFCGQPRREDSSYCVFHHRLCYWKPDRAVYVGRAA